MISPRLAKLCQEIEKLPASEQQTKVSELANEISIDIEFWEKRQLVSCYGDEEPHKVDLSTEEKKQWIFYWGRCHSYRRSDGVQTTKPEPPTPS